MSQFSTFYIGERLFGIDVTQVQEVTRPMPVTVIRLAPPAIKGLINLRGQIATAIGLRELFGIPLEETREKMTVVCRVDGGLLSLLVDRIGDVMEMKQDDFEAVPDTVDQEMKKYMTGVFKTPSSILSVISVENICRELNSKV